MSSLKRPGVHFAVPLERDPACFKQGRELLDQIHRAVLPTGAAYGHGDITSVVAAQGIKPTVQETLDMRQHARNFGLLL